MPRIDPLSLLKCLSVLLGPAGGIKSEHEVPRLANLMTKFSKKLVSKCIYIQILKTTNAELLSQFMGAGGWNLIHMWLTDGIVAKNWALIQELLELLLLCPVDIERLKSNNCPKLIKGLSKEGSQEAVQVLAGRLVEQWLKMVKDAAVPNSVPPQIPVNQQITTMGGQQQQQITTVITSGQPRHQIVDGSKIERHDTADNSTTIKVQDLNVGNSSSIVQETGVTHHIVQNQQQFQDQIHIQPVQLQIINKTMPGQSQPTQIKKQSFVVVSSASSSHSPSVPVYKITIRDGKQVLTKVETDATNITNIFNDSVKKIELNGEIKQEIIDKVDSKNDIASISECRTFDENDSNVSDKVSCEVKQMSIICKNENQNDVSNVKNENDLKDIVGSDGNNKSSDKENRDSYKKDDKSSSSSSSDNKKSSSHSSSKSSSKHGSSSSSRSSSHKSSSHRSSSKSSSSSSKSSRNKDKHGSSSSNKHSSSSSSSKSKSDRDKERDKEKEKIKKDQAEKDKATLEKVQAPLLGTRFGKIPKKKPEDEKTAGSDPLRKSSTDSRDSSKENKDKGDSKKSSPSTQGVLEKKNISVSIENKKNSQDTVRPKTVKTFNSKFRSTGLEEEVKPPPPRSTAAKKAVTPIDKKIILPKLSSLKRVSPLRETGATPEKKAKIALDNSVTSLPEDTKKGAIKLIPPKPKPMVLQESDMFMDALMTASTKNKEPRKRKRRTSISKDTDTKKSDGSNSMSDSTHDASPATSSPSGGDERSSLSIKPDFKFYQDTLETDEDKEDKDRSQDDKDDESLDEKIRNRMDEDDDERSRTPTCDDDSQDARAPASPDDPEDTGRKVPSSPNAEIRYVDGLRSVLLLQKRKGPKKSLKWKTELESVRYFELDETERVNVTKTFTDMKQMEKQNEREAFQMARKLSTEDLMAERTRWKILIPIDLPTPLVEPGKDSKEKEIQYAREKGILQALYFNRGMIPDSPAEPDEERHHIFTDPKIIPLDDLTGNKDSEKDFTTMAWPEPKPQLSPIPPVTPNVLYPPFPQHNQTQMPGLPLPPSGMVPMAGGMTQQMPTMMPPMNHMSGGVQDVGSGAGGWRTGDGKVVVPDLSTMNNIPSLTASMPTGYPPPIDTSMMPPSMMPPPGMYNQDGYPGMIPSEDGNYGHMPNNFQGPGMFVSGPNFPGGPPPPRGAVINPMHGANRGRGGPGWFRGGIGPMRNTGNGGNGGGGGGAGGGANWGGRGGWRGNGKQPPVCRQFTKNGYCRVGDKCQYLHPGVNCPPF